jgi:hypothetical protein
MFTTARAFKKAVQPVLKDALQAVGGYVDDKTALMAESRNRTESGTLEVS